MTLPSAVQVLQISKFSEDEADVHAGMSITGADGNCTSGYSVTDNAGTDGLSTSKHCSDNDDYFEYNEDTFAEEGGGNGGAIDLMWGANSSYTPVNKIQTSSSGNWRSVLPRPNTVITRS